jgi:hypothetical protein
MKLISILSSQVIRLGRVAGKGGGPVYGLNLTKLCEQRYGFLQSPRTLEDYNLKTGVTFLHGYFEQRIVIDKLQIFENGILVEARADTDECEAFLDDAIAWATEQGGFTFQLDASMPRMYQSTLEVQTSALESKLSDKAIATGKRIAETMRGYGVLTPDWLPAGVSFGNGQAGDVASFRFERREGTPPPPHTFFAAAKMRTKDHLKVLEFLEQQIMTA